MKQVIGLLDRHRITYSRNKDAGEATGGVLDTEAGFLNDLGVVVQYSVRQSGLSVIAGRHDLKGEATVGGDNGPG